MNHHFVPIHPCSAVRGWVFLSGLFAMFLWGCADHSSMQKKTVTPPKVVTAKPVQMQIVEWDEYVGRLEAVESVDVRARVSGYLASTHFNEGQIVQAGDILAIVDQRPFQAEVARTEADLAAAQAQSGQARSAEAQAVAQKKQADIRRELAQKLLVRSEQLQQQNVMTMEEYEIREAEFAEADSQVVVAEANIDSARSTVVAAEAAVKVAQANLDLAKLNLQYSEIRSPITGRISRRYVTEGNLISGGGNDSTLLTTIVSVDPIHCYFDTDEQSYLKYLQLAREGKRSMSRDARNPIYLALSNEQDSYPHWGHMDFLENRLDQQTGTIRGRAILPNTHLDLTPGMFTRVRIPGSPRYLAILIPDRAIGTDQSEKFVYLVNGENKVDRRVVSLGPISHGLRVIREGLAGDENVVISGHQRIRPGVEVSATEEIIEPSEESLPDDYEPVPEEKQIVPKRPVMADQLPLLPQQSDSNTLGLKSSPEKQESLQ